MLKKLQLGMKAVADPEICPRGGGLMTYETCGPERRPSFFLTSFNRGRVPGPSWPPWIRYWKDEFKTA